MMTKSGTFLLGVLGVLSLSLAGFLNVPASKAAERPDSKKFVPEIRLWTETGEKVERPHDPVKAQNLKDFAYKVFDPPLPGIDCDDPFDASQIMRRFGAHERGIRLGRWHEGQDNTEWARLVGEWKYPGLSIVVTTGYGISGPKTWLRSITITSPDDPLQHGLRVGLPLSTFIEKLGEPFPYKQKKTKEGREIRYCSFLMYVTLTADQQDRVTKINLQCGELCTR
jgi:hypothetical protein